MKNGIWLFIVAIVVLVIFLPSYSKMQDLKQKNALYNQEIKDLEAEQIKLKEEKRLLEEDPAYLEKVGREKMGLVKEGEVIYRIVPKEKTEE